MQQVAGDSRARFDGSLTNIQYPDRGEFLEGLAKKIGSSSQLPSLGEIEQLWFELQREMTESGRVVKFTHRRGRSRRHQGTAGSSPRRPVQHHFERQVPEVRADHRCGLRTAAAA